MHSKYNGLISTSLFTTNNNSDNHQSEVIMEIENIIFDLDGVIVDLFPEETEKAFEEKLTGISKKI